nr:5-methyltetrahydropteroyltriglutamate--homocysteine methyltransferase [Klebsiella pneumoniae]
MPLEQICLSPQCGFASTEEGMPSAKTSNGKRSVW